MVEDALFTIREVVTWLKGRGPSDEAIGALVKALNLTEAYIYDRDKYGEDRDRERELVVLWTDCANLLRKTNPGLAEALRTKARSWAVPDEYEHSDLTKLRIDLQTIKRELDEYLADQN